MSSIVEIQQAILVLPRSEYVQLRKWLNDLEWDRQIKADSEEGRLDFLIAEALEAKGNGTLVEF